MKNVSFKLIIDKETKKEIYTFNGKRISGFIGQNLSSYLLSFSNIPSKYRNYERKSISTKKKLIDFYVIYDFDQFYVHLLNEYVQRMYSYEGIVPSWIGFDYLHTTLKTY